MEDLVLVFLKIKSFIIHLYLLVHAYIGASAIILLVCMHLHGTFSFFVTDVKGLHYG